MSIDTLFVDVQQIIRDYVKGDSTKTLAGHMLVAALFRIDDAAKAGDLAKGERNRLVVMVLQHLALVLKSAGPGALVNRFRRASELRNSKPVLVITGFDFSSLALPDFQMNGAMLIACNFDEADLRGARFTQCQLQGCTFRRADLSNADFRRCALYGCAFEDANVQGAKGLARE